MSRIHNLQFLISEISIIRIYYRRISNCDLPRYVTRTFIREVMKSCIVLVGRALTSIQFCLPFSGNKVQSHSTVGSILSSPPPILRYTLDIHWPMKILEWVILDSIYLSSIFEIVLQTIFVKVFGEICDGDGVKSRGIKVDVKPFQMITSPDFCMTEFH
jgi:hypothetical protein